MNDKTPRPRLAKRDAQGRAPLAEPDRDMAMHWIDRYAAGIDEECQLDRVIDALTPSLAGGGEVGELDYVPDVLREYADLQDLVVRSGGTFPVRLNGEFPSAKLREWADLMEKDA